MRVLAEANASAPWDLSADTIFESVDCETKDSVDDLRIRTNHGQIFCQIKRTIALSARAASELASAVEQFVDQFIEHNVEAAPGAKRLQPDHDRLVLVCSPDTSSRIRQDLVAILARTEGLGAGAALEDLASSAAERSTLLIVTAHIRSAWRRRRGVDISDVDVRTLLTLMRVEVLDADPGGATERASKDLARSAVLARAADANTAWSELLAAASQFAQQRTGADRRRLQSILHKATIGLQPLRSYQSDIEKLRQHSQRMLDLLRPESEITVSGTTVKVKRPSTVALRQSTEAQSLLVVGQPGAGKSGAMHDLAQLVQAERRDFVFLSVSRLDARSLGSLRDDLGLEHDLLDVLENWPGRQRGFLIIDALDAARTERLELTMRDLVAGAAEGGRWHVAASIRKFDLRYSAELQRLFRGSAGTHFQALEFSGLRHIEIPTLSQQELEEVERQNAPLGAVIQLVPQGLREVLFNIRLLAELLDAGVPLTTLSALHTQLELLDAYWLHRVLQRDDQGSVREAVLTRMCKAAVAKRELSIQRADVSDAASGPALDQLLSRNVIAEWQYSSSQRATREIIAFSHHVLFDYAVARLLLRGDVRSAVNRLKADPELSLFARPSLVLHFHHLWPLDATHHTFWTLVFALIAESGIPLTAQLTGATVSAELARTASDFDELVALSEHPDDAATAIADAAIRHVVGALMVGKSQGSLAGPTAGRWCDLAERLSRQLRPALAYSLRALLITICDMHASLTEGQRTQAGLASRRLAEFARNLQQRDEFLIIHALQCVFRTFQGDANASASVIRTGLEDAYVAAFGFEEFPRLAGELVHIVDIAPGLLADFYIAAFSHRDESEEKTVMGGRVLSLTGTRKQNYQSGLHQLADFFPKFMATAPVQATTALLRAVDDYVTRRMSSDSHSETTEFEFLGRTARIHTDYSHIWGGSMGSSHDEPLRMLNAFAHHLEVLANDSAAEPVRRAILELIADGGGHAVLWSSLLQAGTRCPDPLGVEISELASRVAILTHMDTTGYAGEFLKAVFPVLSLARRRDIEAAILSINVTEDDDYEDV